MAQKYKSYFDFAIRYTKLAFLPPFVSSSLYYLGITTFSVPGILLLRGFLMITEEGKKDFETYFMIVAIGQMFLRSILFFIQKKEFNNLLNLIEKFLNDNDKNLIYEEGIKFMTLWNENKPEMFSKFYFWSVLVNGFIWILHANYKFIFKGDMLHSPIPFYSPYT